jgi:hypothetical protein
MIQAVRTIGCGSAGVSNAPSKTYLTPWTVVTVCQADASRATSQGSGERFPPVHREAVAREERGLAAVVGVRRIQQVFDDLSRSTTARCALGIGTGRGIITTT